MTDQFNLSRLTREMLVSRLQQAEDAPRLAAEIAKQTIVAGVTATRSSGQNAQETVEQICLGAMSGLLLLEKDLPGAAVEILKCMAEASQELHLDPSEMMTWAMRGIARITPLITLETRWKIQEAIERTYLGTGDIFKQLCDGT